MNLGLIIIFFCCQFVFFLIMSLCYKFKLYLIQVSIKKTLDSQIITNGTSKRSNKKQLVKNKTLLKSTINYEIVTAPVVKHRGDLICFFFNIYVYIYNL
jgi:hypothetical protein